MKWLLFAFVMLLSALSIGTGRPAEEVVIYTSIDEPYFTPIFKRFERQTGIRVTYVTDAESSKTAGLAERIIAEKEHPRCDVYWGNEPFHSIRLAEAGCLQPFRPKGADEVPVAYRDKTDLWFGLGLRARMIVVSTRPEHAAVVARIKTIEDLTRPELKGRVAIAHPAFGTTSGHFAALHQSLGEQKFTAWLRGLAANDVRLLGGNGSVVTQVAAGNLVAGLTDNDDIAAAQADSAKVDGVLPDQDSLGTLLIPSTVALVKGAPHEANARKLIEFLADPGVEQELLDRKFFASPVRGEAKVKAMQVDLPAAARSITETIQKSLTILQQR